MSSSDVVIDSRLSSKELPNKRVGFRIDNLMGPIRRALRIDPDEELELAWRVFLAHEGDKEVGEFDSTALMQTEGRECRWDEIFDMKMPLSETNPSTCLALNLVRRDSENAILAGTTIYLYESSSNLPENGAEPENEDKDAADHFLRQGHYKLRLWVGSKGARYPVDPGKCTTGCMPDYDTPYRDLTTVEKLLKEYEDGFIEPEAFHSKLDPEAVRNLQRQQAEDTDSLYVFIKLPIIGHQVVFEDYLAPKPSPLDCLETPNPVVKFWRTFRKKYADGDGEDPTLLEPTSHGYTYLMDLVAKPFTWRWTPEQRAVLWKYRYWLRQHERALPKFVLIIDWDDANEVAMVADVLLTWACPTIWTCLELMAIEDGPYQSEDIDLLWASSFARCLVAEDTTLSMDAQLLLLPALLEYFVRLCRHQEYYPLEDAQAMEPSKKAVNHLADYLLRKAITAEAFAQRLFWLLKLRSKEISARPQITGSREDSTSRHPRQDGLQKEYQRDNVFARLLGQLLHRLQTGSEENSAWLQTLFKEENLFLRRICWSTLKDSRLERLGRVQRIDFLRRLTGDASHGILSFTATPLPYDASIRVTGTLPDRLSVYKSNVMPVKMVFVTNDIREHAVIFKAGEDLRQDMLALDVLQFVSMIWCRTGLDFCLTPYRCLALSLTDGMLEFIPSEPLSQVLATYGGDLLAYLGDHQNGRRKCVTNHVLHDPEDEDEPFTEIHMPSSNTDQPKQQRFRPKRKPQVPTDVMLRFIKSSAGYCVFTYVMGIGDRHLDNLLLARDGRLFHIDFAYLFGRDPKPFPPPMKICREMVEALGGPAGGPFDHFKMLCFEAYARLRANARLLVAFVEMRAGSVGAAYVQERLMLAMEEVAALQQLERLIDESIHALFPKLFETLHKWAQYWRH